MITGLIQDKAYLEHDTGDHPEPAARLEAIRLRLEANGMSSDARTAAPRAATPEELSAIHDAEFINHVRKICRGGLPLLDSMDTAVCPVSYDVALLAAGAGLEAADRIAAGE